MAGKWICPKRKECLVRDGAEDCDHSVPHSMRGYCLSSENISFSPNETECPDCLPIDKWAKAQMLRWKVEGKV
jgi:hypothetical protein